MDFWNRIEKLITENEIIIDRPKGSVHPRFPTIRYPLDYGYLKGTNSGDGNDIDVWCGSIPNSGLIGIACTVDSMKGDSEVKLLIGCTEEEIKIVKQFHNNDYMSCIIIQRNQFKDNERLYSDMR